jgi:hypothetical protein
MKKKFGEQTQLWTLSKYLIRFKFICVILFVSMFQAIADSNNSYSQNVRLDLHLKNANLEQVIWAMQKQSEFTFFYSNDEVSKVKGLDIDMDNVKAEDVLNVCLNGTGLKYEIVNKTIIIKAEENLETRNAKAIPSNQNAQQQKRQISGTVIDSKGLPLPGVTIVVKGTTTGTITDMDGKYTISVPVSAKTLVFSFVGMQTREITISGENVYNVRLAEEIASIDEVVVVGYGAQKKQSVVGSIATVSEKDLQRRGGVYNLTQAISGQMPGITVMEISGEPGRNEPQILVRGMSTWNGSSKTRCPVGM